MAPTRSAAFPLNSPLLPGMALPLRIFEPRYVAMVHEVLSRPDPSFVVALITRGHEVGGGEERSDVGCTATIVDAVDHGGDRWSILAVGTERVRVTSWLPDDPFPLALVESWPDPDGGTTDQELVDHIDHIELEALDVVALGTELGLPRPEPMEFSQDPTARTYQLATISPIGAHDRHRLLCTPTLRERVGLLGELVAEQHLLLRARLDFGRGGDADGGGGRTG